MRLDQLVSLRPEPAAGLLMTLTRRCPLRCSHCSTASDMAGESADPAQLRDFTASFTTEDRPQVLMLTGGEPLLLPGLVIGLADRAARVGTRTVLLSGMFFARGGRVPGRILAAIRSVAHFSASIDAFHEREVPREDVFRVMERIEAAGVPISFHVTGFGAGDPYLRDLIAAVTARFAGRAPMLVNEVRAVGRAAVWAGPGTSGPGRDGESGSEEEPGPRPCAMAAWPTVAFDGTVLACCNQRAVDRRPVPSHLRLGHIAEDDWPAIRRRVVDGPVLRMLRTAGPLRLTGESTNGERVDDCTACHRLAGSPDRLAAAHSAGDRPTAALLDREAARLQRAAGPEALLRRHACGAYAHLVMAGRGPS